MGWPAWAAGEKGKMGVSAPSPCSNPGGGQLPAERQGEGFCTVCVCVEIRLSDVMKTDQSAHLKSLILKHCDKC